jgi:hypothetical protein
MGEGCLPPFCVSPFVYYSRLPSFRLMSAEAGTSGPQEIMSDPVRPLSLLPSAPNSLSGPD